MPKIRIRYLSDKIERLRYIDGKSDWIDLRAAETVELKAGESRYIPWALLWCCPKGTKPMFSPQLHLPQLRHSHVQFHGRSG